MILAARNTCLITWSRLIPAPSRHQESSSPPSAAVALGRSWGWEGGGEEEWESPKKDFIFPGGEWDSVGGELNWYCKPWSEGRNSPASEFPVKMTRNVIVNGKIEDQEDLTRFKRWWAMCERERENLVFFFFLVLV